MSKEKELLVIRKAVIDDYKMVSELEALELDVHMQARPDYFISPDTSFLKTEFEELLALPRPIVWLAELEGRVVGLCFGKIENTLENPVCKTRCVAFIQDLVTLPECRGQGVATALIDKAREQARSEGAESLELCVWNFNEGALRLYEKMGMKIQYYRMEEKFKE